MAWPKGRPRPKKVGGQHADTPPVDEPALVAQDAPVSVEPGDAPQGVTPPADWNKGALLNVRDRGSHYVVTLYPEEYDPRYEERSIKFTNVGECQNWVSAWYARESHDPRAR